MIGTPFFSNLSAALSTTLSEEAQRSFPATHVPTHTSLDELLAQCKAIVEDYDQFSKRTELALDPKKHAVTIDIKSTLSSIQRESAELASHPIPEARFQHSLVDNGWSQSVPVDR